MNLFRLGGFTLSSGGESWFKIDCDALSEEDIQCLANMIRYIIGPFSSVEGIPSGGLRLAKALERYVMPSPQHPHLIVDDVLTTGESYRKACLAAQTDREIVGAVVFARGQLPLRVKALFQMPECFWTQPRKR